MSDLFADPGSRLLERLDVPAPYLARVGSLRRLIDDLDVEVDLFARLVAGVGGPAGRRPRLPGRPADPGRRPHPGRGVRRRDR